MISFPICSEKSHRETNNTEELLINSKGDSLWKAYDEKTKDIKRSTIQCLKKITTARSLSPVVRKNIIIDNIDNKKLVNKYKMMRIGGQERDIRLNHLINELHMEMDNNEEDSQNKIALLLMKIIQITIE